MASVLSDSSNPQARETAADAAARAAAAAAAGQPLDSPLAGDLTRYASDHRMADAATRRMQKAKGWLHRLAVACVVVSLLPIVFGALTTTEAAGMSVPDYPQTFGQNMFTYNMFQAKYDVFLEHTHRLGGTLIGLLCLAFFGLAMVAEDRRWMKVVAAGVLLGVISQGLLGGVRVLRDATSLAMAHGFTAALFFSLLVFAATATGTRWKSLASQIGYANNGMANTGDQPRRLWLTKWATILATGTLMIQYLLGGALRHHQIGRLEHAGFAAVAWSLLMVAAVVAMTTRVRWVKTAGYTLTLAATSQVVLGLWTYATKYGWGSYVASYRSTEQVTSRTVHMVIGVLLMAATLNLLVRVWRTSWLLELAEVRDNNGRDDATTTEHTPAGAIA